MIFISKVIIPMKVVKTIYRIMPNGQISSEYVETSLGKPPM